MSVAFSSGYHHKMLAVITAGNKTVLINIQMDGPCNYIGYTLICQETKKPSQVGIFIWKSSYYC